MHSYFGPKLSIVFRETNCILENLKGATTSDTSASREPTWHRNRRKQRAEDRRIVRRAPDPKKPASFLKACGRLERHHGTTLPPAAQTLRMQYEEWQFSKREQKKTRRQGRQRKAEPYVVCSAVASRAGCAYNGWAFTSRINEWKHCRCGRPWAVPGAGPSVDDKPPWKNQLAIGNTPAQPAGAGAEAAGAQPDTAEPATARPRTNAENLQLAKTNLASAEKRHKSLLARINEAEVHLEELRVEAAMAAEEVSKAQAERQKAALNRQADFDAFLPDGEESALVSEALREEAYKEDTTFKGLLESLCSHLRGKKAERERLAKETAEAEAEAAAARAKEDDQMLDAEVADTMATDKTAREPPAREEKDPKKLKLEGADEGHSDRAAASLGQQGDEARKKAEEDKAMARHDAENRRKVAELRASQAKKLQESGSSGGKPPRK